MSPNAKANGNTLALNPEDAPLKGAEGMKGDGEVTLGGVSRFERPAIDSRSMAGLDIVKQDFQTKAKG
jgi:hypothetical protein